MAGAEAGVLHYASDATVYMANLAEADAPGGALSYTSAFPVQAAAAAHGSVARPSAWHGSTGY